jgi:hypothetical protein
MYELKRLRSLEREDDPTTEARPIEGESSWAAFVTRFQQNAG